MNERQKSENRHALGKVVVPHVVFGMRTCVQTGRLRSEARPRSNGSRSRCRARAKRGTAQSSELRSTRDGPDPELNSQQGGWTLVGKGRLSGAWAWLEFKMHMPCSDYFPRVLETHGVQPLQEGPTYEQQIREGFVPVWQGRECE